MAHVMNVDGAIDKLVMGKTSDERFKQFDNIIGDTIQLLRLYDGRFMIIDDNGKLKKDAVLNKYATLLYNIGKCTVKSMALIDVIVGPAIIATPEELGENTEFHPMPFE